MSTESPNAYHLNRITSAIIAAAIEVHRVLGPGLLEEPYRRCLAIELRRAGRLVEQKRRILLAYKGERVGIGYEADLVVDGCVIVEVKAIAAIHPIHEQQLLTYLRLADCRVGLLLNFGEATLKKGIRRVVNGFPDATRTPGQTGAAGETNAEGAETQGTAEGTS